MRRWAQYFKCEEQLIFLDFFCHGVPSKFMWNKYVEQAENKVGKLIHVSWRNKVIGSYDMESMAIERVSKYGKLITWHDSYNLLIKGEKGCFNSKLSDGDMFYRFFLSDSCLGKQCYDKCRFKYDKSSADIRIGDAWGSFYKENENGVSSVIAFTEKGMGLLKRIDCELIPHKLEVIAEGQLKTNPNRPVNYNSINQVLKNDKSIFHAYKFIVKDRFRELLLFIKKHPRSGVKKMMNFLREKNVLNLLLH